MIDEEMTMPFGRYRGVRVIELPEAYCEWLQHVWPHFDKCAPSLKAAIKERLRIAAQERVR